MRKLVVTRKTGYQIADPYQPVIIRDNRQLLFYSTEDLLPKIKNFNLPGLGTFWIETGNFKELQEPVKYNYFALPKIVRVHESPFNFKVIFGINPNKATIKWAEKLILIDSTFEEKPISEVIFILYHEFAHAFKVPKNIAPQLAAKANMTEKEYQESVADLISGNYMLSKGFNPEQIGAAPVTALSERQIKRKENMIESIIKSS